MPSDNSAAVGNAEPAALGEQAEDESLRAAATAGRKPKPDTQSVQAVGRYPQEAIGADFIARALDVPEKPSGESVADVAQPQNLPRERPRGMMSLGGWW
jgi:hypothetical protein